jgi:hypothetical protein
VPIGFVKTRTSPIMALSGMIISSFLHTDVATPPTIIHGLIAV